MFCADRFYFDTAASTQSLQRRVLHSNLQSQCPTLNVRSLRVLGTMIMHSCLRNESFEVVGGENSKCERTPCQTRHRDNKKTTKHENSQSGVCEINARFCFCNFQKKPPSSPKSKVENVFAKALSNFGRLFRRRLHSGRHNIFFNSGFGGKGEPQCIFQMGVYFADTGTLWSC